MPVLSNQPSAVPVSPLQVSNNVTNPIWTNWFGQVLQWLSLAPAIGVGYGAPTVPPIKVGNSYCDLTNKKYYIAFGVSNVSDWVLMN